MDFQETRFWLMVSFMSRRMASWKHGVRLMASYFGSGVMMQDLFGHVS